MEPIVKIAGQDDGDSSTFSQREAELAELLKRWDPIGVYGSEDQNPDETEYDDLVRPLLSELKSGTGAEHLKVSLMGTLRRDYFLDYVEGLDEFCSGVLVWWTSSSNT
jgi:hypothetical protein